MTRTRVQVLFGVVVGILSAAGVVAAAQNALAQIGQTEEYARTYVLENINAGRYGIYISDPHLPAFRKLPAATRGTVTTGLYAWTKTYVNSPAFKKTYAENRAASVPVEKTHEGTVDQEVKAKLDKARADGDESYKAMVGMGMKAQADEMKKQMDAMLAQMASFTRAEVEQERAKDKADFEFMQKDYAEYWPADPLVLVAGHLRAYLANTADVDFAAKQQKFIGEGGEGMEFASQAYRQKPWQWKLSYDYGPEVTAAGRAAAQAWLKELPGK